MRLKKLKQREKQLFEELYDLHHGEPSPDVYLMKRNEIEYQIVCVQEAIEIEQKMAPLKYMLYGFIVVACAMLVWAYVVSK